MSQNILKDETIKLAAKGMRPCDIAIELSTKMNTSYRNIYDRVEICTRLQEITHGSQRRKKSRYPEPRTGHIRISMGWNQNYKNSDHGRHSNRQQIYAVDFPQKLL